MELRNYLFRSISGRVVTLATTNERFWISPDGRGARCLLTLESGEIIQAHTEESDAYRGMFTLDSPLDHDDIDLAFSKRIER